jgi:hypothetical protein
MWINMGTITSYTFKDLKAGSHTVYIKVIDKAGNINNIFKRNKILLREKRYELRFISENIFNESNAYFRVIIQDTKSGIIPKKRKLYQLTLRY